MMAGATNYSPQDAADALGYIDPGCERAEWVKVAMAAKAAGVEFDAFDAWSEGAPNYTQAGARDTWRGIAADGGIKAGTLFHIARAGGWPGTASRSAAPASPRKAPKRPPEAPKCPRPGMGCCRGVGPLQTGAGIAWLHRSQAGPPRWPARGAG